MDFFHSWIYVNILNAKWFIWTIVVLVLAFNIFSPLIVWAVINGRKVPVFKYMDKNKKKSKQKDKQQKKQKPPGPKQEKQEGNAS